MILKKIKKVETIPSLPELRKNTNLKRHVLDLCKSLLNECGVEGLDSIVDEFARFTYSAIEDMSMIINLSMQQQVQA